MAEPSSQSRACPSDQALAALLDPDSSPAAEEIQSHLDECADCRRRLESLASGADSTPLLHRYA
ncbi:MAG: hypothetical protein KDM63_18625, partial [Verrucomicrobiae bacterium]|nr:hypothetical protein [Verrucomicrobiae bacterium]